MSLLNQDCAKYVTMLSHCFFMNEELGSDDYSQHLIDKPFLIKGLDEKLLSKERWRSLLNDLQNTFKAKIRNMEMAGQRHSYSALYKYNQGERGIIFAINFPLKLFGFYFSKLEKLEESRNFESLNTYSVFDNEMEEIKIVIMRKIAEYFSNFQYFENDCATYKIKKIEIDGLRFKNLDLWQAIFTTNMHGLI